MILIVLAVVLIVRILQNLLRPRKKNDPTVGGNPQRQTGARKSDDIEDAEFREIK
jgi:hypothetical protein